MPRKPEFEIPPKEELEKLREGGKSRIEIATYYGVSLSRVKRWIAHHGIPPTPTPNKMPALAKRQADRRRALGEDDGLTLVERARVILGKRMSEDYRGYLLDGRPVRIDALAKAAGLEVPKVH